MTSFDPLATCCLLEHFLSPLAAHSESLTQPFRVVVLAVWPAYATRTRTNNDINKVATRLFIISSIFFNVNRFDMSGGPRGVAPGPSKREQTGAKKSKVRMILSPLVTRTLGKARFIPQGERNKFDSQMSSLI